MVSPVRGKAARLREWARRVKRDGVALLFACRHPATPWWVKVLCGVVVAYALSPIDLIPDFIPVLGYLDDVLLLPALIWLTVRLMPAPIMAASRDQATQWLTTEGKKPRSRWGVVLVVGVWLAVAIGGWAWWSRAGFSQ
ncbi:YkvA family protein [Cupriavidus campinensis]|uniref:YkvA family protein n=1 Tax=Cupriavidus campinensis TaxID=151783 RepID=A0AAE9I7Y2_9BURK|nr:YkvA family protein [Cupriavidus campinensis]URF05736.1 YkvA family protein [Cupriavidus campinensis]